MILCRTFYTLFIHSLIVIEVYTLLIYCFTLFIHFRCHVRVCFCVGWTPTRLFLIRKDDFQETGFLLVLHQRDRLVRSPTADGSDLLGVNSQHHNTMCYHIWWRSCSFAKMVDFVRMISIHGATKSWCMFQNLEKAAEPNAIISDVFWSLPAQEQASPIVTGSHFLGRLSPWLALCPHMTRASASNESFCSALMSNSLDCYLEGSHKWKVQRSGEKKLDSLDQSMTIMTIMILLYTHVYFCMSMYLSIYSIFLFIYLSIYQSIWDFVWT